MPLVTIASAISLISFSLTLQANLFQLFQPIGGVLARPLSCAAALDEQQTKNKRRVNRVFIMFYASEIFHAKAQRQTQSRKEEFMVFLCAFASAFAPLRETFFLVVHQLTSH